MSNQLKALEILKDAKNNILNNNSWAVTRFLNHHGGVNCSKNREELKKYDLYRGSL